MATYGTQTTIQADSMDQAVERVTAALASVGFGVLWTIDVEAVMDKKLGVEHKPYRILGACNPALARDAIAMDDQIGLLLPCNVVVQQAEGGFGVSMIDPHKQLTVAGDHLVPVADQVAGLIATMFQAL